MGPTLKLVQRMPFDAARRFVSEDANVERMWRVLGPILEENTTQNLEPMHFASAYLIAGFSSLYEDRSLVEFASRFLNEFESFSGGDEVMVCSAAFNYYDYFVLWREAQVEARTVMLENELRTLVLMPASPDVLVRLQETVAQLLDVVGEEDAEAMLRRVGLAV